TSPVSSSLSGWVRSWRSVRCCSYYPTVEAAVMVTARRIPVGLSTASVYPENTEAAFRFAADLDYDGVELMVWADPVSQDPGAVQRLVRKYGIPVLAVHVPCL